MEKIEWKGGECPVSVDTRVRTWWTDCDVALEVSDAGDFRWDYDENAASIIAYEVIEEEPKQITEKTLWDEYALAWITSGVWDGMTSEEARKEVKEMADAMMKARAK